MEALNARISVIMPVKRWHRLTAIAIKSILRQTVDDIELLLIGQPNQCSLARNLSVAGISDERIKVIPRSAPGIVHALNTGLHNARGDFIARMDDDDFSHPNRLQTQLQYLNDFHNERLCAGKIRFIDKWGTTQGVGDGNQRYAQWLNAQTEPQSISLACFAENPMPHPTLMGHRSVWHQLNGYRDIDGPEDHDLILRAKHLNIPMGKPETILLDWREHESRLTYTDKRYRRQAFIALAANTLAQKVSCSDNCLQCGVWIAGTGKHARYWHDALIHAIVPVRGFVDISRPGKERSKRNLPVLSYQQLADRRDGELIISAVSQVGAKAAVRKFCQLQQWVEGIDFIMGC